MSASVLLDTHTWIWALIDSKRLSAAAGEAISMASQIYVSPISFYEVGQKARIGKWPDVAERVSELARMTEVFGATTAELGLDICLSASQLDWPNRDPFDRMIAATALVLGVPLVSADPAFDSLPGRGVRRIW